MPPACITSGWMMAAPLLFEQFAELVPGEQALAGRDRHRRFGGYVAQAAGGFAQRGLLHQQRLVGRDGLRHFDRRADGQASRCFERKVQLVAHRSAHRFEFASQQRRFAPFRCRPSVSTTLPRSSPRSRVSRAHSAKCSRRALSPSSEAFQWV